jgi:hypothetical protein
LYPTSEQYKLVPDFGTLQTTGKGGMRHEETDA